MKVFGPYTRSDGRKHIITVDNKVRRTISYPKWLVEQQVGRQLDPVKETVDHIDGDFTNDDLANLRVIPLDQHAREDSLRAKMIELPCVECAKMTSRTPSYVRGRAKNKNAGPFCGKECLGKYGARVQNGGKKLPAQEHVKSEYYKVKKI